MNVIFRLENKVFKLSKKSDDFEKQIYRIHKLLEDTASEIIWTDKIPDPDNPDQNRQIDISIKNGDKLTLIECRIHQQPQDVKWIEELIGRKISLQADTIIAVSDSGFTRGAIKKANSFGIILRDLYKLSDDEIKNWCNKGEVVIGLYEYKNLCIDVLFPISMKGKINEYIVNKYLRESFFINDVIQNIKRKLNESKFSGKNINCKIEIDFEPHFYKIEQTYIAGIIFKSIISLRSEKYQTTYIVLYDDVNKKGADKDISVEKYNLGNLEVIKSIENATICLDLAAFKIPDNCQFNGLLMFDMGKPYKVNKISYLNGNSLDKLRFTDIKMQIGYCEYEE